MGSAGVKRVINGQMIWSPDSAALFGPVPKLKNYFCCNGIIPGFSQSGGLGLLAAQWIVEGEPELDLFPWDMARFGDWPSKPYTRARALDCYANRFKIHFPYEEREAGRPLKTRPVYERQKQNGAVFGLNYGWEHPLWFAGEGVEAKEDYGFERQDWHEAVKAECEALRSSVGMLDVSNYAKYEIRGPGCGEWLDRIVANNVPTETGRSCLTPMLGVRGGIAGDFTITKLDDDHFWMFGSGMAEGYHQRFWEMVPPPAGVTLESRTQDWCGFSVAGPKSREMLQRMTNTDLSNDAFRFMRSKKLTIAGIEALSMRVSFTGDLGWEIYVPTEQQVALFDALMDEGKGYGIRLVGGRSLLSLRIEKGYGSWGREYSPEYWPHEVGLERLIKMTKPEFLGRDVWQDLSKKTPREKLVMLSIDATSADAHGGEPIFLKDGTPVGRVSSGAYGHTVQQSLALCFIRTEHAVSGAEYDVAVLGKPHHARLLDAPPFDPEGQKLRN